MQTRRFILVVEDERDLSDLIVYNLKKAGFDAHAVSNGRLALESLTDRIPDLILLDVMLPELSGTEVASRLRSSPATAHIPIIMLTAKGDEVDQLVGLKVGADDYIPKPFSIKLVIARIEAVLRRSDRSMGGSRTVEMAGVSINNDTHEISVDGEAVKMTLTEFRLLAALIEAGGRVLSRSVLMGRAMGPGITVTERTIDVHLTAVRKKLGKKAGIVKTVRGVGYRATPDLTEGDDGEMSEADAFSGSENA